MAQSPRRSGSWSAGAARSSPAAAAAAHSAVADNPRRRQCVWRPATIAAAYNAAPPASRCSFTIAFDDSDRAEGVAPNRILVLDDEEGSPAMRTERIPNGAVALCKLTRGSGSSGSSSSGSGGEEKGGSWSGVRRGGGASAGTARRQRRVHHRDGRGRSARARENLRRADLLPLRATSLEAEADQKAAAAAAEKEKKKGRGGGQKGKGASGQGEKRFLLLPPE